MLSLATFETLGDWHLKLIWIRFVSITATSRAAKGGRLDVFVRHYPSAYLS
jgi:hypothetical protein